MDFVTKWVRNNISRRKFLGVIGLGLYSLFFKNYGCAKTEYMRVKEFLIRSSDGTQHVDLKVWRLKI